MIEIRVSTEDEKEFLVAHLEEVGALLEGRHFVIRYDIEGHLQTVAGGGATNTVVRAVGYAPPYVGGGGGGIGEGTNEGVGGGGGSAEDAEARRPRGATGGPTYMNEPKPGGSGGPTYINPDLNLANPDLPPEP